MVALADTLGAPVVHALRGKQFVEWDNPFDVGMTGLIGFSSGYHAMESCDTLLMLGTDFPYRPFYPSNAKIAQIDWKLATRPSRAARARPRRHREGNDRGAAAALDAQDAAAFPRERAEALRGGAQLDDLAVAEPPGRAIHPQYLTKIVDEVAAEDAIFTADVGTPTLWAARYLTMNGKRQLHGSFNHGSMANAMPQALARRARIRGGRWCRCPATAACRCCSAIC